MRSTARELPTIIGLSPVATNDSDPERPGYKLPWTGSYVWRKLEKPLGIGRGELGRYFRLANCVDRYSTKHETEPPSTEELLAGFRRVVASGTEFILMWSRLQAIAGMAYGLRHPKHPDSFWIPITDATPLRVVHPETGVRQTFYTCRYPTAAAAISPRDLGLLKRLGNIP